MEIYPGTLSPSIYHLLFQHLIVFVPGSKLRHFKSIHKKTGIAYADMLFFDDESRNKEVEQLG